MKVLWIGGNHPRHLFFARAVEEQFGLDGAVIEKREYLIPEAPSGLLRGDRQNFERHFGRRAALEEVYFGNSVAPDCSTYAVSESDLNTAETACFVSQIAPDVVFVFGCDLIRDPLFSALPPNTINLHLGLSPRYRGSATLFWPFYFLEPNWAGTTFHHIISEPDAGNVIHQTTPTLEAKDGIHDVGCKAVVRSSSEAVRLLEHYRKKGNWRLRRQRSTGKNFLSRDFRPEHLRVIYNVFDDDVTRHYLSGNLKPTEPRLFDQFASS